MKTTTSALLLTALARLAPSIALSVSREIDEAFRWDGDGPDPRLDGFDPYDVTVTARAIIGGAVVEGNDYLGGCYFKPDEDSEDIHGYLPQMITAALDDLESRGALSVSRELINARAYVRGVMRAEYEAQTTAKTVR